MRGPSPAERAAQLRAEIERHDHAYFVLNAPIISDEAYDALVAELRAIESAHPDLRTPDSPTQRVGERPVEGFAHVRHSVPMLSIDNSYNPDDVRKFDARVRDLLGRAPVGYFIEPKIDGVAVNLRYENGLLALGATRGDGETGDDITANVRAVGGVALRLRGLGWPAILEARGEVYWPRPAFNATNEARLASGEAAFANPRNATAGTLKQLDPRIVAARKLRFSAHGFGLLDPFPPGLERYSEIVDRFREWGLPVSPYCRPAADVDAVLAFVEEWSERRRTLPYDTDGLVVKVDSLHERESLGFTSKAPRWCIAYKYSAEQAQTQLQSVDFQVGKLGTITPVANLAPVPLAGTTVRRATLHNFANVERLDLHVGDWVTVEKAGEIIPQVVGVDASRRDPEAPRIARPETCPACGSIPQQDEGGVYWRCVNPRCPAQLVERLRYFCGRDQMDIEGAGAVLVESLVRSGLVSGYPDLFRLRERRNDLLNLDRMGEKSADNLLAGIDAARTRPLSRVLAALAIPHIGLTTAELLAQNFPSVEALQNASFDALQTVDGIGPEVAGSLRKWLDSEIGRQTLADLASVGVNLTQPDSTPRGPQPLAGKTLVVTGTLEKFSRGEIESLIKQLGGKASGSVSKKTDFLVAGAEAGSKLEKARSLGVTVLSEAEFVTRFSSSADPNP